MSWLQSIFGRRKDTESYPPQSDFSAVVADIHSHLIPGIDDGVSNIEESLAMLRGLKELGYRKIITTPHIMSDYYRNTPEIILSGLEKVRAAAAHDGLGLEIHAAAEYYLDEQFVEMVNRKERLLTLGGNHLLFEISYINPPDNLHHLCFELNVQGYMPVLAHPERYPYWYGKEEVYTKLKDQGVLFQLNTNSLVGYYGPAARACAEHLIDRGMIDFIGSDMHGARHLDALRRVPDERYFRKLVYQGLRNNLI
ncbi:MAG: hypothetical protein RL021_1765 [Bacteroidota bacterium]|jgi:tyrosine-protein phosphatase YwqE